MNLLSELAENLKEENISMILNNIINSDENNNQVNQNEIELVYKLSIQKLIEENDRLKKENFEYIKSLDELNELNESYQNLIKENEKLKNNGNENRLEMLDDKINSDDINDNEESN